MPQTDDAPLPPPWLDRRGMLRGMGAMGMAMSALGVASCATGADFAPVDRLLHGAAQRGDVPGVVAAVGHGGRVVYRGVYGQRALVPETEPESWDTHFDMASLTKPTITAPAVMQLWEQGAYRLDEPVARYLPEFAANGKDGITIRHLLTHYSGLPPDLDLSTDWHGKDEAVRRVMLTVPTRKPGVAFVYSDINFITLGLLVERVSGMTLDRYAAGRILAPLGMRQSGFLPAAALRPLIAPTQFDPQAGMLRGVVHDPTARRMGGVAGHAGLFSDAHDMTLYAQALLDRRAGRPSAYPLKRDTLEMMTTPEQPAGRTDLRGLGWDIATHYSTPRGAVFPVGSFGHTGFTGTSLWMDPGSDSYVLILTNRVHPSNGHGRQIIQLRHDVATAAAQALGLDGGPA
ncbi:serine hydrolase domain-containing protein [Nguyenibacter vanlangensis]